MRKIAAVHWRLGERIISVPLLPFPISPVTGGEHQKADVSTTARKNSPSPCYAHQECLSAAPGKTTERSKVKAMRGIQPYVSQCGLYSFGNNTQLVSQFNPRDQNDARALLSAMRLVSRDTFAERLRDLILRRLSDGRRPVGLYVEREIRRQDGKPDRLFQETRTKVRRAYGAGPQPVRSLRAYAHRVGSEGIVAQLASELCRQWPKKLLDHPGPDAIRKLKVRRFFLLTDFIGSGERARTYLDAAWRVRSVRSWWSARGTTGLSFEVLAFAGTPDGRAYVEDHPSAPRVSLVTSCPTVDSAFRGERHPAIRDLCVRYDPVGRDPIEALGYHGSGALIAFAHGAPNNCPRMLHSRGARWAPLFPKRVTSANRSTFVNDDADAIRARLFAMRQARLAEALKLAALGPRSRANILVLAALANGPRHSEALSGRTGLTLFEVGSAIAQARKNGWIDRRRRLTDSGQAEIAAARRGERPASLPSQAKTLYFPTALRVPVGRLVDVGR